MAHILRHSWFKKIIDCYRSKLYFYLQFDTIASFFPKTYSVLHLGQFMMGASYSAVQMMAIEMADNWFPKHELEKKWQPFRLVELLQLLRFF